MSKLTSDVLREFASDIKLLGENITKTNLKTLSRGSGYSLDNFQNLFQELSLEHNGKYTIDNHKIYDFIKSTQHMSKTKHTAVDINDMPKPYLRNAVQKYMINTGCSISDILNDPKREGYKLLKAFFTFEIRENLK